MLNAPPTLTTSVINVINNSNIIVNTTNKNIVFITPFTIGVANFA